MEKDSVLFCSDMEFSTSDARRIRRILCVTVSSEAEGPRRKRTDVFPLLAFNLRSSSLKAVCVLCLILKPDYYYIFF